MKQFIYNTTLKVYEFIFKIKASDDVKRFIKNLSYVALGFGFASFVGFIFQVLAGRILGPAEYGEFALIQSIAMFFYTPMILGMPETVTKYASEKEDLDRQRKIVSSSVIIILVLSLVSLVVILILFPFLPWVFSVSREIIFLSVTFAILFAAFAFLSSVLQGLHKMKWLAISQAGYDFLVLILFFIMIQKKPVSFMAAFLPSAISYAVMALLIAISLRKYFIFLFDKFWGHKIIKYGVYSSVAAVSSAFYFNVDKLLINKYMPIADVGIYRAYYTAFIILTMFFFTVFNAVFFPMASKHTNKENIFKKVNKLVPFAVLFGLPLIVICGYIILRFYGHSYSFDLKLAILFAIAALVVFFTSVYNWLMASVGRRGIRITAIATIILAVTNFLLNALLIPRAGLSGAVIALILSYLISLAVIIFNKDYYKLNEISN